MKLSCRVTRTIALLGFVLGVFTRELVHADALLVVVASALVVAVLTLISVVRRPHSG